jgi:hypothetical protein
MHIGETPMRLRRVMSLIVSGSKRWDMVISRLNQKFSIALLLHFVLIASNDGTVFDNVADSDA